MNVTAYEWVRFLSVSALAVFAVGGVGYMVRNASKRWRNLKDGRALDGTHPKDALDDWYEQIRRTR